VRQSRDIDGIYISIFLDSEQSVIFIGIIVGLSFVAVLLASISLILIKKSKKKSHLTHFEKSNSFQANIYTQNTFCKVRLYFQSHKQSQSQLRPVPCLHRTLIKTFFRILTIKEASSKDIIARQSTQHQ